MNDEKVDWECAYPPALLSVAEVERLLAQWLAGRRIAGVELMQGGLMNRNFRLTLDGPPYLCVLRLYDRSPDACARELFVLQAVGGDVPVPAVLHAELHPESGPPFAVLSFAGGISLFTLRKTESADAVAEAVYEIGLILPRLARHPAPPTPAETIAGLVDRFTASPAFERRVPAAMRDRLLRLAADWEPRIAETSAIPSLVHGDFNSANILVVQTSIGWRVSAILDWEFALSASPYCDIGNFLRYHRANRPRYEPDFSRGLRDGGMTLPSDWLMLARLMDLPALCELLARPSVPGFVVSELLLLIEETTDVRAGV